MKLSPAQRQALEDGVRYGDVMHSIRGQSRHGGWASTSLVLIRNGWIDRSYRVTDKGRAMLAAAKEAEVRRATIKGRFATKAVRAR